MLIAKFYFQFILYQVVMFIFSHAQKASSTLAINPIEEQNACPLVERLLLYFKYAIGLFDEGFLV